MHVLVAGSEWEKKRYLNAKLVLKLSDSKVVNEGEIQTG
jgi:hypothetical protein